ncbi:pre-B-cell leukemia homeobox interacting protein 1b isoform X2 [Anabas testudineus]|uniref:pre-B-cell leukemia homeobox interacting protein 1b isoform X2 n=1 Tax=Anabas testudineus TaxID=64144 RepID=UPI000E458EEF|nr:pre-B-cell leukemia homeobox interacting protein 1b isoform X2 [Anabas testudineus]
MSGGSSANNSWTILTPEETVAETLRPLAEGTEHHEETIISTAGPGADQPAERSPVEGQVVSEEAAAQLSGDSSPEQHISGPTTVTDASVPTSLDVCDALSHSEGLPEGLTQSSPDPDSFSDSYTHISTSPDETPVSLLSTDTLEGGEFRQDEERLTEEGTLHLQNGEELQQEGKGSDLSTRTTDLGKQADSPVDSEVGEEKTEEQGEPEVRRRSRLAALERIGRTEEEEEADEEFRLPRREEDSGFSVNKCILGAVILLGLGTIFLSGLFTDLDEDSDYGTRELKDSEVPVKQEWLNPDVPPAPVDADSTEILNKLAEGNQQISVLQAQLQAQKEELKVARGQAAVGEKERLQLEELEKENSRLKTEMASFSVLRKENERMKRELESVSALQKELETLRSTETELKLSPASEATEASVKPTTSPPSGQTEDTKQGTAGTTEKQARKPGEEQKEKQKDRKRDKYDTGEKKDWKEIEKSEWKEGQKRDRKEVGKTERKTGKHEQGKFDKKQDKEGKQKNHNDETKQWKEKEKASRGDEGKPWKTREGKKEWIEKSERQELQEEKEWKKAKHKVYEGKQLRDKEEKKDWKGGNDYKVKHRGNEEWKGGKEWKKVKDGSKESGKEKWEKKDWKEKGEKKEWKTKNQDKEGKVKGERKQWQDSEHHGKERREKNERKQWSEKEWKSKNAKDDKEWKWKGERKQWEKREEEEEWKRGREKEKRQGGWKKQQKDEHKFTGNKHHDHNEEHVWGDRKPPHTHRRPSLEQPEYWVQQRDRLHHNHKPPQHCSSLETCAQAEGLSPVPLPEFEAILQNYLAKAEETGVEAAVTEELKKLTTEFFKGGVFVHDQMSFQDFVEDVSDILEHMVEGDEDEEEEEDSAIEEEMEEFEREVLKKFSAAQAGEKEERIKGEWRKESGRGRG